MKLHKATMDDAEMLLRWKNDPTMRKFSIVTNDEIKWEDHLKWLEKHLDEIYIIGDNYGDIRITGDEIAIKIDPEFRGLGIGKEAIRLAQQMRKKLIAKIVDGNVPSMRLFIGCGFNVIAHKDNYYILKWGED